VGRQSGTDPPGANGHLTSARDAAAASLASTTPLPQSADPPVARAALNRTGLRRFALTVPRAVPQAAPGS